MSVKQISVFIENKKGKLAEATRFIADHNINLRALSIADTTDFGIVRFVVRNAEDALKLLKENGCTATKTKVIAFSVPDAPGGMYSAIDAFESAGINVEYCYSLVTNKEGRASVAVRVDDNEKATEVLTAKGIKLLEIDDIA